jgi:hypothetical protein
MGDGVFGNLPRSRPGVRSPRRPAAGDPGDESTAPEQTAATPRAETADAPPPREHEPARAASPATDADPDAPEPAGGESSGGLEDLAWAGIAAAAEAATLGIRLATRAIESVRGNPERR